MMDKDAITSWALANGWQLIGGHPSLTRPTAPAQAILRMVFKATVVQVETKKPSGAWQKVSSESYAQIMADPESGMPLGLGFEAMPSITMLMRENKDRQVFARMGGPAKG